MKSIDVLEVFLYNGYKFFFYMFKGSPTEPIHVHLVKGSEAAKLWMTPEVTVAYAYGISPAMLRQLVEAAEEHRDEIERKWHELFSD